MEWIILIFLFLLVCGMSSINSNPSYRGGTMWSDIPPPTPLTKEEAEKLLLPHVLFCTGDKCLVCKEKKGKNQMPKFTPEELLIRAGHRHPSDIVEAIQQEYDIVPKGTENNQYQKFVEELNGPTYPQDQA